SEIATYKRTAEESSAELSRQIQLADGKAVEAKTYAQQTAEGFKTRLESLETYKDGESTRASQYFTASRAETAKQLSAERAAIATNYVAKSTYDENVRGTTLKLNEIKSTADTAKQNLATYQNTVDRKLEELTSSTQTLDGKINTASAKVDTVAGQIRTEIGTVEAKIPTEAGGRNYILKSQAEISSTGRWVSKPFNLSSDLLSNLSKIKTVTISCDVEGINVSALNSRKRYGLACSVEINGVVNYWEVWQTQDTTKKRISQTFTVPEGKVITKFHSPTLWIQAAGDIKVSNPKIEFGRIPTDHTLAPEDFANELSSVKTTITQTASGVEQLSTSLATTDNKVTTAEAKIRQLISDVSSKVSQTDYNTLTGRVDSAETAITQNATEISKRLTSTQVNQAILADKQIKDTRNDNQNPQWYWSNYPKQTVEEFKASAVIGLTGESTYAILTTNVQWDNSTGGKVKQTAKTDRATFERYGAGTTWGAWTKIANAGDLANYTTKTEFQTVKETTSLYERIIGSTETGIKDKVARMVMADSLFLTEVKDKISGTATQVSQLNNSYAIKNLTSAGTVLNQFNLLANGTNRIDGRLTHITGQTLIDNGVIINAMIGNLDAGKIKTGTLDAARIRANSIDGSKIVFDQAFLNKMTANEALFKQLFAQSAFITSVQAVAVSAKQIAGGIAKALNGGMDVNFDESKINFYTNVAAIRRIYTGHPTQFIKFETEGNYSRTIIGSNRNGGEVFNSATFAGIVVENTNNINTEDNVRIYGDNTLLRHAQGDVGWNINSVTQRIVPANINAESEIWSKHFVAPDKNSKPIRLDTAVAALWDIWNHIIYNNFEFNAALRTHIKARRDNWKFELNL
ncbi:gp58-like family protein, partial [Streptococcus suis]